MENYLLIKALHIISFTAWMAGMFYLPRLFAYHAAVSPSGPEAAIFTVMERRLLRAIMNPAMVLTLGFGIWLVIITGYGSPDNPAPWLMAKLLLVLGLAGLHGFFSACRRKLANGTNTRSARFYKIINELVTLFFIAIVLLAVVKPF
ncbi:MAG: CopD family protein [Pseudomonadota bacterium]